MEKQPTAEDWVPPEFSRYGLPMAKQMRDFIFRDPTAQMGNTPEQWRESGAVITIQRKRLVFTALTTSDSSSINIGGGKNAIVFSRFASVRLDAPASATLPNSMIDYFTVQIEREDNLIECPVVPISHHFGTSPGWPVTPALPEFWLGTMKKTVSVVNNWGAAATIFLTWEIASLNTGR